MIPPLLRPQPGPFQVVAAATVGYERRRWSGTSVRHPRRWNREGAPTWPRGRDVTHPRFHFGPRHRHRSASSWYLWRSCTTDFDRHFFPFFFFFFQILAAPCPHTWTHIFLHGICTLSFYTRYIGRRGYINVGTGKTFWDRNVEFSKVSQTFRDEIPKIEFLREGRILGRMVVSRRSAISQVSLILKIFWKENVMAIISSFSLNISRAKAGI